LLTDVSFSYRNRKILEKVNLSISYGDFATIVGPNGGGKTTLLKLMLGLLKPDTGTIEMMGTTPEKSRLDIGYMPQYSKLDMQFPVTVMDVVLMGRLSRKTWGRYSPQDRKAATEALEEVRLLDQQTSHFSRLSGGQKQRVLIARALCSDPRLLILDEPTSNIDEETEHIFFEMLERLNTRMTILLVSHDLGFASQKVKNVICVNREVVMHPTTKMDGTTIKEIYGGEFEMIRHDHRCSSRGALHE